MSGDETRRRASAAIDTAGGLEAPMHALLRGELARDPESKKWVDDVQTLEALLRGWPEQERGEDAWEGLAARIEQRLSETLPAGLDVTAAPFFDEDDSRTARPDSSSGSIRTDAARHEIEAKRAAFSLANLHDLDAPKAAAPPPTPPARTPKLGVVPAHPSPRGPLPPPTPRFTPAARPQGEERFSIPTFLEPPRPLAPLALAAAPEQPKRGRWLLLGGAALAAAAVVLFAVVVVPGLSNNDAPAASAVPATAATAPMAAEPRAPEEAEPSAPADTVAAAPALAPPAEAPAVGQAEDRAAHASAAPVVAVAPSPPPSLVALPRSAAGLAADSSPPSARPAGGGGATSTGRPRRGSAGPVTVAVADSPSRAQVIAAMNSVHAAVTACAAGRGGLAQVRVTFGGSSGRVMSATVEGTFAGTPQGSCIARAVRAASVPRFTQPTSVVLYPFQL